MLVANYQFKKDLKAAVGEHLLYTETSMFNREYLHTGEFTVVGPDGYDRKWFATVTMKDGRIEKVT